MRRMQALEKMTTAAMVRMPAGGFSCCVAAPPEYFSVAKRP
jgi:hypothetical protein